jgi:membrane dipeptidase
VKGVIFLRYFDLHCDSITRCYRNGEDLQNASGSVAARYAPHFEQWTQIFAIFVPDSLQSEAAYDYYCKVYSFYREQCGASILPHNLHAVLAIENGNVLCGDCRNIASLAAQGVRVMSLTWNGENELGFGCDCDETLGLKSLGKDAVRMMLVCGIVPDVSHLNIAGFWDVLDIWAKQKERVPILATHSNAHAVHAHRRNLKDDQLQAIFSAGGLVGLNFYPMFLGGDGAHTDLARHLRHIITMGGAKHVAIGSDFDGAPMHPNLTSVETIPALRQSLLDFGIDPATVEDLFWNNAARILLGAEQGE